MNRSLTFDLTDSDEAAAFGLLVLNQNKNCIPFALSRSGTEITIEILEGY